MNLDTQTIVIAFLLTLGAGLATGFGSLIALLSDTTSKKTLSIALGFSAGVMLYISFTELLTLSQKSLSMALGDSLGHWASIGGFFAGILLIGLIDFLVPNAENPHELHLVEETYTKSGQDKALSHEDIENDINQSSKVLKASDSDLKTPEERRLMRLGVMSALAIGIHNFPEGLATFIAALHDVDLGISIAVAIAIHNIPEGIAVSVPIYFATKSRRKAFRYSFLSGLAEPAGAIVGFLILLPFLNETIFGLLFAFIAGIMVYISLDELLPAAREYDEHHLAILGLVAGMAIMAISLAI